MLFCWSDLCRLSSLIQSTVTTCRWTWPVYKNPASTQQANRLDAFTPDDCFIIISKSCLCSARLGRGVDACSRLPLCVLQVPVPCGSCFETFPATLSEFSSFLLTLSSRTVEPYVRMPYFIRPTCCKHDTLLPHLSLVEHTCPLMSLLHTSVCCWEGVRLCWDWTYDA